jgi:hypothetical protein
VQLPAFDTASPLVAVGKLSKMTVEQAGRLHETWSTRVSLVRAAGRERWRRNVGLGASDTPSA